MSPTAKAMEANTATITMATSNSTRVNPEHRDFEARSPCTSSTKLGLIFLLQFILYKHVTSNLKLSFLTFRDKIKRQKIWPDEARPETEPTA